MTDKIREATNRSQYFTGMKIEANVPPFGWEKALYVRRANTTHHQIFRIDASSCDWVKDDHIKAVEWIDDQPAAEFPKEQPEPFTVESRLRVYAKVHREPFLNEAADEIARLKAENAKLRRRPLALKADAGSVTITDARAYITRTHSL